MELKPYHLHPAAVHFPIVLLTAGVAAAVLRRPRAEALLLRLGTLSAWLALALGLLAENTAPHKPLAWEVLADHERLAWWTCGTFSVLAILHWSGRGRAVQLLLWLAGAALLVATAMHGAELVYGFGMGVNG